MPKHPKSNVGAKVHHPDDSSKEGIVVDDEPGKLPVVAWVDGSRSSVPATLHILAPSPLHQARKAITDVSFAVMQHLDSILPPGELDDHSDDIIKQFIGAIHAGVRGYQTPHRRRKHLKEKQGKPVDTPGNNIVRLDHVKVVQIPITQPTTRREAQS